MDTLHNFPTRARPKILFGRCSGFPKTKFSRISVIHESRYFGSLEKIAGVAAKKYFLLAVTGRYFWPGRPYKVHHPKNGKTISACEIGVKV